LSSAKLTGRVSIDADIVATERAQQGSVDMSFEDLEIEGVSGISGKAHAALDDGRLVGQAELQVAELGALGAAVDLKLDGRVDDVKAWKKVTGSSRVELYAVNLKYVTRYLKPEWGIADVGGLGTARVRIERDAPEGFPSTMFDAQTHGLRVELAAKEPPDPAQDGAVATASGTVIQGIDLQLGGTLHGPTGQSSGSLRVIDAEGPLASASVAAALDVEQLWNEPESYWSVLRQTPMDTVFVLPPRKLEELPPLLRPPGVEGVVSGRMTLAGKPGAQVLSGLFDVERLRGSAT